MNVTISDSAYDIVAKVNAESIDKLEDHKLRITEINRIQSTLVLTVIEEECRHN